MIDYIKRNIVNGIITTIIGSATMLLTLFLVYKGTIDFVWEGIAGLSMGTLLVIAPRSIEKNFGNILSALGTKLGITTNSSTKIDSGG
jgi:peptidoglycan/LPS O-acetylase OafA/YrhL